MTGGSCWPTKRARITGTLRGPWTTKHPPGPVIPMTVMGHCLQMGPSRPCPRGSVGAPAPALHVVHACPCAQLHTASHMFIAIPMHTNIHSHTVFSSQSPVLWDSTCFRHGIHDHTHIHTSFPTNVTHSLRMYVSMQTLLWDTRSNYSSIRHRGAITAGNT